MKGGTARMNNWLYGVAGSSIIALLAYRKLSLSRSGVLAAVPVGAVLYAWGSLPWFGTLLAFFLSSSFLSRWKRKRKEELERNYEKTGRRDAGQVLANGGAACCLCIAHHFLPHPGWWAAFLGIMAAVNADTWATEIGGLSRIPPRSILTGKIVPPGTSGGVTPLGTLAALCGGFFIGASAWMLTWVDTKWAGSWPADVLNASGFSYLLAGTLAGTAGALVDSLLGARLQTMYLCPVCEREVERAFHCGKTTVQIRGFRVMNNDGVNFLSSLVGGLVALWLL
jgi:uncharacterized protein (TIGR00297 family)